MAETSHVRTPYYRERIAEQELIAAKYSRKSNLLVAGRLAAVIAAGLLIYLGIQGDRHYFWFSVFPLAVFIWQIRIHQRISYQKRFALTLMAFYEAEIAFLEENSLAFEDGSRHIDPHHAYSYDLDLFGPRSLYQYLNRTETFVGSAMLSDSFLYRIPVGEITDRQDAISELAGLPEWRMDFRAKAHLASDSEALHNELTAWAGNYGILRRGNTSPSESHFATTPGGSEIPHSLSTAVNVLRFVLPVIGGGLTLAMFITGNLLFGNLAVIVFTANMIVLSRHYKAIQKEITVAEKISETLRGYAAMLQAVENKEWKSSLLQQYSKRLQVNDQKMSALIDQLSAIFSSLESIQNGLGAIIFNGTVLYHLHTYHKLLRWKTKHASLLRETLQLLGELEMLSSFGNLNCNNPEFCFPEFGDQAFTFEQLGHPLISAKKRVCNDVDFSHKPFMILTGSNMSGKSTFLRTLGINLVLANAGSCVCAKTARLQSLEILVSMRLSDSLADSESYFFAEVKRLKEIVEKMSRQRAFVLLDEILRGTNSDDKRSGTVAVIEKMVALNAIGAIATHDLEVCETVDKYPAQLSNNCFEVEIKNNELHFDYTLRQGICQNKSATFLMKKMGVIDS